MLDSFELSNGLSDTLFNVRHSPQQPQRASENFPKHIIEGNVYRQLIDIKTGEDFRGTATENGGMLKGSSRLALGVRTFGQALRKRCSRYTSRKSGVVGR